MGNIYIGYCRLITPTLENACNECCRWLSILLLSPSGFRPPNKSKKINSHNNKTLTIWRIQWFQNTITKNTKEGFEKPIKIMK